VGCLIFNNLFHKNIRSKPRKYCYHKYFGPPNPSLMIDDLKYKDSLISYYEEMEKGYNPYFNFPIKEATFGQAVYVLGYTSDSTLIEILSYRKGKFRGSTYDRGYVYYKTLHETPPDNGQ
jgi:hypothetical protein